MIVVDSSVWISILRRERTLAVNILRARIDPHRVLVGDLVLLEVLQGARDDRHAADIERDMREYDIVPMLDSTMALEAARLYRTLRGLGITANKLADLLIATFCVTNGHELLHDDRDFDRIAKPIGLRVVAGSRPS